MGYACIDLWIQLDLPSSKILAQQTTIWSCNSFEQDYTFS